MVLLPFSPHSPLHSTPRLLLSLACCLCTMAIDHPDQILKPIMQAQDFCNLLALTDEGTESVQCDRSLPLSTSLAVQGNHLCLDVQVTGQKSPDLGMEVADTYCPCAVDVDIEKGNLDKPIINDECASIKTEISLTKPLRRQNSLQPGGEPKQPFMNHILMLLKLDAKAERAYDAPNSKWRKYKRPAAFDSRQIVLLFSILSSMGTIVLIFLTLRVRQAGEGFVLG